MKRIVLDVDGTLCTATQDGSYTDVVPLPGAVETVRRWHRLGYYIIIQTARHMRTCGGNEGQILAKGARLLIDWLDTWGIPYDEVYFGKPHADIFIDDKGFRHLNWSDTANFVDDFMREV